MTNSRMQITLFGDFSLVCQGQPAPTFNGERPISLLAYLLLHRHTAVSRHHLAFTLWPDSSDSQARTNLRNLLYTLRQTLPHADNYLAADSLTLQWRPDTDFTLDVAEFEAALAAAKKADTLTEKIQGLETAVSYYKDDLLPGNYDDWIIPIRESLRQDFSDALHQLVQLLEQNGDLRAAARISQRLIQNDPLDEIAYVQLMRLYALSGDRTRVRRVYEQCTAVLKRELDVEPAAATQAAYTELMHLEAPPANTSQTLSVSLPMPRRRPFHLPQINTPFVGREQELAEISSLLSGTITPLVTIVGPGGAGKTRLAIRVATELADTFTDGVVFVSLASVLYVEGVPTALAAALELPLNGNVLPEDEIVQFLQDRDMLIIMDNLEHLLEAAHFLARITQQAPGVRLLATSRERLRVQAEWVFKLGGLMVPPDPTQADIANFEAVRLFVERAQRTGSGFILTPKNQIIVGQICRLLDGLPLALELAAAQISFLPPEVLLQRLDQALPLLVDGARDLPERQRTIRATIEWSTNLLADDERSLFKRLAVFMGGFTLEAAESICADEQIAAGQVLTLLWRLVEHSLLVKRVRESGVRYRFLEPIRQFAVEQLTASSQVDALHEQHARYFLALAEEAAPKLQSPEQVVWLGKLAHDFPNLRAAMRWYLQRPDLDRATRLCWDLWIFLWLRGYLSVGRRWVEQFLPQTEQAEPAIRGRALLSAMVIGFGQGDYAWAATFMDECFAIYHSLDEPINLGHATSLAALITASEQKFDAAEPLMELGVQRYLAVGSTWNAAMLLSYWAAIPRHRGDYGRARQITERALTLAQQQGDRVTMYSSLFNLASIAQLQNDYDEALRQFRQALALADEVGDIGNILPCLSGIAEVAVAQGDVTYAVRLWGAAESLLERSEAAIYTYAPDQEQVTQAIKKAQQQISDSAWQALWQEGRALTLEQVVGQALQVDPSLPE